MGWKTPAAVTRWLPLLIIAASQLCDASRRPAQRRSDSAAYQPSPSMETLGALAAAAGAAEARTEGRVLVKRRTPAGSQPDLDGLSAQGVIGKPGVDFPAFPNIPTTGFNCKNVPTGYYADLETDCQVFHICDTSRKISFLCPNGTIFSQSHLICDWWFKVDCASSPALYESSAEYYSNEQKKTHKITQSLSKTPDLQQIGSDASIRAERPTKKEFPSTTERFIRHKQRLQGYSDGAPLPTPQATARSFQYPETPRSQPLIPSGFEKRRKNLVSLIGFNHAKTTQETHTEATTYRNGGDFNGLKEMQVAAESASFLNNNNNRQSIQDYNKNYRPYPVYTPTVPEPKPTPSLTTLFDFRSKNDEATTKRPTLLPYTKSYTYNYNEKRQPYTRPGVSLLKNFLDKERNKTFTSTEKITHATESLNNAEIRDTYETVTKTPQTTRSDSYFSDAVSSDRYDYYLSTNVFQATTEPSYQERRDRLLRKLNVNGIAQTETPVSKETFGKRPGLIVPPSLTPKSLHTLAIYYATAVDNLSTTSEPEAEGTTTTPFDNYDNFDENLPALFTHHTINKYSKLFGMDGPNPQVLEEIKLNSNETLNELADDLAVQQSQNPLSSSPQLRELAQVFTHALSAYLQDPVQFRKVLSDIRPTQPSFDDIGTTEEHTFNTEPTTTINEEDEEILGFSDDNKIGPPLAQLRDGKALNPTTIFPIYRESETTTPSVPTTEANTSPALSTTLKSIFKCCGRISASYTTASTQEASATTPSSYSNTIASNVNTLANNYSDISLTTESLISRYGGFQNNTDDSNKPKYNNGISPDGARPLSDYVAATNLPSAWGVDTESTIVPTTDINIFESKKIKPTTYAPGTTPVYFTDKADSVELENEEELQRAQSQSFLSPKENNILRHAKNINLDNEVRRPSEDLEAPTLATEADATAVPTTQPTTPEKEYATEPPTTLIPEAFTADGEKSTNQFQWSNAFENWQSTVVLDPITLNDGLSDRAPLQGLSQLSAQTTYVSTYNTATTPTAPEYTGTSEQAYASSQFLPQTTPGTIEDRLANIKLPTSTESGQDLTTIADVVAEKAKEIMGGMNATTTEKLMNVMKKTKSKTVRRLILLLVQTCDDDHKTTAEASKRALLEALMAVSQKDMDEIAKEQEQDATTPNYGTQSTNRRNDRLIQTESVTKPSARSGKSLDLDAIAVNALSNPAATTTVTAEEIVQTTASNTTPAPFTKTTPTVRRGVKKFYVRSQEKPRDAPIAEARVANPSEVKPASDTRALELLRSLYTIAARWG